MINILILFSIFAQTFISSTKKLQIQKNLLQTIVDNKCFFGTQEQVNFIETQLQTTLLISQNFNKNCKNSILQLWEISETFQYGNWCGKNYGGFNNDCRKFCEIDLFVPNDDCVNCNQPIDWVDEQCMYHDFCMTRFQSKGIGYGMACSDSINLGNPFPSPCNCAQNLTEHLKLNYLIEKCQSDVECEMNGEIIQNFFNSELLKCSCTYVQCNNNTIDSNGDPIIIDDPIECWNATACVTPEQCTSLNGV
ncbi:unnamed protein product [Paramecium octaurelia]|uniref:Uncharacterized protein n=2 Tax=Paramecium octaurelia TaxID=43137 RepID=A0A8S1S9W8_PAROT|nr:unnamed protein product [Paramecium octaurelia]